MDEWIDWKKVRITVRRLIKRTGRFKSPSNLTLGRARLPEDPMSPEARIWVEEYEGIVAEILENLEEKDVEGIQVASSKLEDYCRHASLGVKEEYQAVLDSFEINDIFSISGTTLSMICQPGYPEELEPVSRDDVFDDHLSDRDCLEEFRDQVRKIKALLNIDPLDSDIKDSLIGK